MSASDFIGRGLAFPLRIDGTGTFALSTGGEAIEQAMSVIIATAPGERVMRPTFGCAIWDLLFSPINANTLGMMAECVREALGQWEPRAEVDDVVVLPDPTNPTQVNITVSFRERTTNDRRNLVYPFYVIPQERMA